MTRKSGPSAPLRHGGRSIQASDRYWHKPEDSDAQGHGHDLLY
ncbi:hypothetical protein [Brucella gallinifaecis]|nr:hypothetical protein [Brucella gallinifaecis]